MSPSPRFSAQAFDARLANGRCGGELLIEGECLHFVAEKLRLELPLPGLVVSLGGADNRVIFITHPACEGCQLYTTEQAFLAHPALAGHPALAALGRARQRQARRLWGRLLALLLCLGLLPVLLYLSLDGLSAALARRLPLAWEQTLGETAFKSIAAQSTLMPAADSEALLQPLVQPLLAQAGTRYRYRFHVINDASLNAFALPAGDIVIHSGLILRAQSAAQLQGVLAHEISHVSAQHGLRALLKSLGVYAIAQALLGDASGLAGSLAQAAPMLVNQKHSRDFEREADDEAVRDLLRAQVDPTGLLAFFRAIAQEEERQLAAQGDASAPAAARRVLAYLGSHPDTAERIARLQAQIKAVRSASWRDDRAAFSALQTEVRHFVERSKTPATAPQQTNEPRP